MLSAGLDQSSNSNDGSDKQVKLLWMIVAGLCIAAAAVMIVMGRLDVAFVVAAIGVVAWFLNYRIQMKEVIAQADIQNGNKREELNEDQE